MKPQKELAPNWWDQGICPITGYLVNSKIKGLRKQSENNNKGKKKTKTAWS